MKFRLELKNFGPSAVHYDSQRAGANGSLLVRDPQGRPVRYIGGSFQTGSFVPLPSLAPGKTVVLFDELDLPSQYLLVIFRRPIRANGFVGRAATWSTRGPRRQIAPPSKRKRIL